MANEYEMYDYLSVATADYDYTLDLPSQGIIYEKGAKNIRVKEFDDANEARATICNQTVFYVTLQFTYLSESNAGIIFDLYHNTNKAIGMAKTWKWIHYGEPSARRHTYVVRFAAPLSRKIRPTEIYGYTEIKLKVLGRIADP